MRGQCGLICLLDAMNCVREKYIFDAGITYRGLLGDQQCLKNLSAHYPCAFDARMLFRFVGGWDGESEGACNIGRKIVAKGCECLNQDNLTCYNQYR